MLNSLKIQLQYLIPQQRLTELAGWLASRRAGGFTQALIRLFIRIYRVDMSEAVYADPKAYPTFNDFFVRPLREDARPIAADPEQLACPADGIVSQCGALDGDQLVQAKGHTYTLDALLAGNREMVEQFSGGTFITTYLSPRDYHRVHMPCNGILREMIYVPGALFSVNPLTAENVPNLFARNERIICRFDTDAGPMVQILVGATIVGSIETVWAGCITPPRNGIIQRRSYPDASHEAAIVLLKGQEMGRFKLGSTVINLFAPGQVTLSPSLTAAAPVKMGEPMGTLHHAASRPQT